uniref:Nuclear pore complex protein n=1 Tax=Steinernema glaseri TaxID=37863 RepID=A0A1I7Z4T0_9BILA
MFSSLSRIARSPIATFFRLKSTDPSGLPAIEEGQAPATSAKEHHAPILLEPKKRILANLSVWLPPRDVYFITLQQSESGAYSVEASNEGNDRDDYEDYAAYDLRKKLINKTIDDEEKASAHFQAMHSSYYLCGVMDTWEATLRNTSWVPNDLIESCLHECGRFWDICSAIEQQEKHDVIGLLSEREETIFEDSDKLKKEVDNLPEISDQCGKTLSERLVKRHGEGALPALRYVLKDLESSYSDRCFNFRDLPANLKLIASQLKRNKRTLPRKPIEQRTMDRFILLQLGMSMIFKDWMEEEIRVTRNALNDDMEFYDFEVFYDKEKRLEQRLQELNLCFTKVQCSDGILRETGPFEELSMKYRSYESRALAVYLALEKITEASPKNVKLDDSLSESLIVREEFESLFHEICQYAKFDPTGSYCIGKTPIPESIFYYMT